MEGAQADSGEAAWSPAAVAALVATTAFGVWLRLQDPLSSPVIGAEDPYTHLVFTKEHLAHAQFEDSRQLGFSLYPPGLHVLVAALHAIAGVPLYELARFLPPVLFGGMAVAGTFVVGHRLGGAAAGTVAAVTLSIMPEHVFRTNQLFPTALDLALLPLLLLAVAELAEGRRGWAWVVLGVGATLMVAHPWVVPLAALAAAGFLALRVFASGREDFARTLGYAALAGVLMGGLAAASAFMPGAEGSYEDLLHTAFGKVAPLVPLVAPFGVAAAGALVAARFLWAWLPRWVAGPAAAVAIAVGLHLVVPRLTAHLPRYVNYAHQFGHVPVWLALAGVVALPLGRSRLGLVGLGLAALTFPLTAVNVFESAFWPHRTVAYLALGVALLAGALMASAVALLRGLLPEGGRWRLGRAVAASAVALALVAPTVSSAPSQFDWYRLYDDASYEGVAWALAEMERDPDAIVASGHWIPNVVLRALGDEDRVKWAGNSLAEPGERSRFIADQQDEGRTVYFVVDAHTRKLADDHGWSLGDFDGPAFEPVGHWGDVTVYRALPVAADDDA